MVGGRDPGAPSRTRMGLLKRSLACIRALLSLAVLRQSTFQFQLYGLTIRLQLNLFIGLKFSIIIGSTFKGLMNLNKHCLRFQSQNLMSGVSLLKAPVQQGENEKASIEIIGCCLFIVGGFSGFSG